ncbi:GPN-loop GTPase, partial [Lecanoromycetidae sp. Uapishka_2]
MAAKPPVAVVCVGMAVFNKTDVKDADFAKEWMTDFEAFQAALNDEQENGAFGGEGSSGGLGAGSGYMGSLLNSMSLMLEEFYRHLSVVGVSSMTGKGIDDFFSAVQEKAEEFERDYKPELEKRRAERERDKRGKRDKELGKMMKDMNVSESRAGTSVSKEAVAAQRHNGDTLSDLEDDPSPEFEANMVDPDEDEASDGEHEENGLSQRYKQALTDETSSGRENSKDHSFARYLRTSQLG